MDKFWKNTIIIEILTVATEPPTYESLVESIMYDVNFREGSMVWDEKSEELTKEDFVAECEKQDADPAFFFGEEGEDDE